MTIILSLAAFVLSAAAFSSAPHFVPVTAKEHLFTAELATTPEQHARGLMYRQAMADNYAMLFIFPDDDYRAFWMKNTLIALDIIYIDSSRHVVSIAANVPPCKSDPCPSYESEAPARFVLEIRGGLARELNLQPGDMIDFMPPGK